MSPVIRNLGFVKRDDMEQMVEDVRRLTGVTQIPVNPFAVAAKFGLRIEHVTFEDISVEGVLRFDGDGPLIQLNESARQVRQRFTVAHEVGHYLLHCDDEESEGGDSPSFLEFVDSDFQLYRRGTVTPRSKANRDREIQANMFAAALLMPRSDVVALIPRAVSVKDLARTFGVSEIAMHYRINELDV